MRAPRDINLRRELATALAVLVMLLQVVFSPILIERHALNIETDNGLSVICGSSALDHADPASADTPAAPTHDHQSHDCPCCFGVNGHSLLPEPAAFSAAPPLFALPGGAGWTDAQVAEIATLSDQQLARGPPALG